MDTISKEKACLLGMGDALQCPDLDSATEHWLTMLTIPGYGKNMCRQNVNIKEWTLYQNWPSPQD